MRNISESAILIDVTDDIREAIKHLNKAQELFRKSGIDNITQPGLIKEVIMADSLGHKIIKNKHLPDATDGINYYEYLSCQEKVANNGKKSGTFAIDCMFSDPERKPDSLERITRNKAFYCGVFEGLTLKYIYKVSTTAFLDYTEDNLTRRGANSKNKEHTINYPLSWVSRVGKIVNEI
jgi:hypothetical protein